ARRGGGRGSSEGPSRGGFRARQFQDGRGRQNLGKTSEERSELFGRGRVGALARAHPPSRGAAGDRLVARSLVVGRSFASRRARRAGRPARRTRIAGSAEADRIRLSDARSARRNRRVTANFGGSQSPRASRRF